MVLVVSDGLLGDEVPPQPGHADDGHDPDGVEGGDESKEDEPEPESDVNLLVDDVESEDTESVQLDDGPGGSVLVEGALGDSREHLHHGVRPVLVILVHEVDDVGAVGHEHSAKEEIDKIHLSDDIDEVEKIAEEIPENKEIIKELLFGQ